MTKEQQSIINNELKILSIEELIAGKNNYTNTKTAKDIYQYCRSLIPHIEKNQKISVNDYQGGYIVQHFAVLSSLEQFQSQKEIFKKNKENSLFKSTLFLMERATRTRGVEKLELLLDWGYNPNEVVDYEKMELNDWLPNTYINTTATPLHIYSHPSYCEILLKNKAELKTVSYINSALQAFKNQGINQIEKKHIPLLIEAYEKHPYCLHKENIFNIRIFKNPDSNNELALNYLLRQENRKLYLSTKALDAYTWAVVLKNKNKHQTLKKWLPTEYNVKKDKDLVNKIIGLIEKRDLQGAKKALLFSISLNNEYLLENLELVKPLINEKLLFNLISGNSLVYIEKIVEKNWIDKSALNREGDTFLMVALKNNKPDIFKLLDKANYPIDQSKAIGYVDKILSSKGYESNNFHGVPITICYYLAGKGYRFNNNILTAHAIEKEKSKLELDFKISSQVAVSVLKPHKI